MLWSFVRLLHNPKTFGSCELNPQLCKVDLSKSFMCLFPVSLQPYDGQGRFLPVRLIHVEVGFTLAVTRDEQ